MIAFSDPMRYWIFATPFSEEPIFLVWNSAWEKGFAEICQIRHGTLWMPCYRFIRVSDESSSIRYVVLIWGCFPYCCGEVFLRRLFCMKVHRCRQPHIHDSTAAKLIWSEEWTYDAAFETWHYLMFSLPFEGSRVRRVVFVLQRASAWCVGR